MEVGFNSPSRKRAHLTSTKGDKARKAQGRGERNHIIITSSLLTKWNITWGPSHTPFRGMRWLVDSYSRCGADSAPRHNHTPTRTRGGGGR
eukprot:scaffold3855_cov108-Isochrysis_galbana.AAC.2